MSFTEEELEAAWNSTRGNDWADWEMADVDARARYRDFANALPVKREGEPIDPKDVRVGDIVMGTIARQCSEYSRGGVVEGAVYQSGIGRLCVTGWYVDALDNLRLINRPAPQLPTEAPAVIKATEVRGVKGEWWLTLGYYGDWASSDGIAGYVRHYPEHITEWKLADFVVREEQP